MQLIVVFGVVALMLLVMGIVIRYKQIMAQIYNLKSKPKTKHLVPPPKVLVAQHGSPGPKLLRGANRSLQDHDKEQ
jgi:hypothetical protein